MTISHSIKGLAAAAFLITVTAPAWADDVPRFDIRVVCAKEGERNAVSACERTERTTRGIVQARWAAFPKQRKHFCIQSVTFRPKNERSYVTLAECLDDPTTS